MSTAPWPFIDGCDDPQHGYVPNLPSDEGISLGREIARLSDAEYSKTGRDTRCPTCAFRLGTPANQSAATMMNATKCIVEGNPFCCHETDRPCGGWVAFASAESVVKTGSVKLMRGDVA